MVTVAARLSRDDWIAGGLERLLAEGPTGVAVQPVARMLGATKGSFYWHFASRDDLVAAVLARWEIAMDETIAAADAVSGSPTGRAAALLRAVLAAGERHPGQLRLLGDPDPAVRAAVDRVAERRISYLAGQLRRTGLSPARARRRALLAYCAYLGYAQLFAPPVRVSAAARRQFLAEVTRLLVVGL